MCVIGHSLPAHGRPTKWTPRFNDPRIARVVRSVATTAIDCRVWLTAVLTVNLTLSLDVKRVYRICAGKGGLRSQTFVTSGR